MVDAFHLASFSLMYFCVDLYAQEVWSIIHPNNLVQVWFFFNGFQVYKGESRLRPGKEDV
jgi:hypothetical protein